MSSEQTENPVLLWGDMGPDVYKLSQIYDPRNDRYVTTQDTSVQEGTDYYERLDMILTSDTVPKTDKDYYERVVDPIDGSVTYTRVTDTTGKNPAELGWYQNSEGKIKVFSKVDLEAWAEEHGTTVDKINPYLPYGTQEKEEKDWIHWYEVNPDSENTCGKYVPAVDSLVVVDETDCYYKIENKYKTRMLLTVKSVDYALNVTFASVVFGTDTEETTRTIDYGNEKFMLFFNRKQGADTSSITLTPDRKLMLYGKNSYGYRLKRDGVIISKIKDVIQTHDDAFIPYSRAAGTRVNITAENYESIQKSMPYVDIILPTGLQRTITLDADPEALMRTCDTVFRSDRYYYTATGGDIPATDYTVGESIKTWEEEDEEGRLVYGKMQEDLAGRTCYVMADAPSKLPSGCVFIPEPCYLPANYSIVDGESITMEIFSFDYITNEANLIMTLTVLAKEATPLDLTDVTTRQIVKFDVELNGHDDVSDVWYLQQGEDWREVFNVIPKISFDDGSDLTVPVDGKTCYRYGFENINSTLVGREFQVLFKFFPSKTLNVDWQKIGLSPTKNYLSCRKTIKIINNLAYTIRKISLIPAWDQDEQAYKFRFMIFRNDFTSPPIIRSNIDTRYRVETYTKTTDATVQADKNYYQKQNSGYFTHVTFSPGKAIPSETGCDLYERTLQPKTTIDDVQYMNATGDTQYVGATAAGSNFDVVQHGKLAEKVTIRGMNAESVYTQDIVFKLQNMMLNSTDPLSDLPYKWTIGDDHTTYEEETMPYGRVPKRPYLLYTYDSTKQGDSDVIVGSYRLDPTAFSDVEVFLKSFYYAAQPPRGVPEDQATDTEAIVPTHFFIRSVCDDSACTELIPITTGGSTHLDPVLMTGGGQANTDVGGAIPVKLTDTIYGQGEVKLMGTVIVEFVRRYQDPDDATKYIYKHLYAVPVETRDTAWS